MWQHYWCCSHCLAIPEFSQSKGCKVIADLYVIVPSGVHQEHTGTMVHTPEACLTGLLNTHMAIHTNTTDTPLQPTMNDN